MSSYGRNFEFRVPPRPNNRGGRYKNNGVAFPIGAPVKSVPGAAADANGRTGVGLAAIGDIPDIGSHGIAVYEHAFSYAYAGQDPALTTPSDLDLVPAGAALQLVNGDDVKVVLRNTVESIFLGGRTYPGRIMVAGLGATPTIDEGDYLGPGAGNDVDGFWAECDRAHAWLHIVTIDPIRLEVEARLVF